MNVAEQPGEPSERLAVLRQKMIKATADLIAVFNTRGELALQIALAKQRGGIIQVRDFDREAEVLKYAESINEGPFSNDAVCRLVQLAMDEASSLQAEASGLPLGEQPDTQHQA
jgi:chorismate mutase